MKKKRIIGMTALLPFAFFQVAELPVYAEVADSQTVDTSAEETSAECQVIYKSTYSFSEEIPKYSELDVTASGYEGTYDGKYHGIRVECRTKGASILYSKDGKTYSSKKPEYREAGIYVTYYKVEKDGYVTRIGTETVRIREAVIDFTVYDYNGSYDGKEHGIDISVQTDGCKILYSEDGINFTSRKPKYKEPGTYVVYYKIMRDNYETVTGSSTVTIREKESAANSNNPNSSQNNNSQNSSNQNNSKSDGKPDTSVSKVQTGDESHILFYGVMFTVSLFGLLSRGRKGKRKL